MKLTRAKFEQLVDGSLPRSVGSTKQRRPRDRRTYPSESPRSSSSADRRASEVQSIVKGCRQEPHKGVNPDEVVAVGAAVQAGVLAAMGRTCCCSTSAALARIGRWAG